MGVQIFIGVFSWWSGATITEHSRPMEQNIVEITRNYITDHLHNKNNHNIRVSCRSVLKSTSNLEIAIKPRDLFYAVYLTDIHV